MIIFFLQDGNSIVSVFHSDQDESFFNSNRIDELNKMCEQKGYKLKVRYSRAQVNTTEELGREIMSAIIDDGGIKTWDKYLESLPKLDEESKVNSAKKESEYWYEHAKIYDIKRMK